MRGYDKKQVDEYIHKTTEFGESKIRELEDCVERLKQENDYLYAKNAEYRRNEERVSGAILKAMEIKGTMERELQTKIALEEDRLIAFKKKWTAYARGLNKSNADAAIEDAEAYINAFRESFIKRANRDLNVKSAEKEEVAENSYLKEQARLSSLKGSVFPNVSDKEKMSAASVFRETETAQNERYGAFIED